MTAMSGRDPLSQIGLSRRPKSEPKAACPSGRQIAAARVLLGMTQVELARRANLSASTLKRMEASSAPAMPGKARNFNSVHRALADAGIELIPEGVGGIGVRLKEPSSEWASDFLDLLRRT
jgi:transcriptional regulator with XRE-family HTH domain